MSGREFGIDKSSRAHLKIIGGSVQLGNAL
jgi:hypothetical protein